jgi:hypothetical protein
VHRRSEHGNDRRGDDSSRAGLGAAQLIDPDHDQFRMHRLTG